MIDAMTRGASVVLLGGAQPIFTTRTMVFRTSWWKAGEEPDNNLSGTFVYEHPATRAMAPDGWCDDGWLHLLEGGKNTFWKRCPPGRMCSSAH